MSASNLPVGLAVPLDVEEEHAPHTGVDVLRPADEPEERARRVLEPLVGEHDVVERHAPVVDRRHCPSRLVHGAVPLPVTGSVPTRASPAVVCRAGSAPAPASCGALCAARASGQSVVKAPPPSAPSSRSPPRRQPPARCAGGRRSSCEASGVQEAAARAPCRGQRVHMTAWREPGSPLTRAREATSHIPVSSATALGPATHSRCPGPHSAYFSRTQRRVTR